jgi:hypothetical protein
MPAIADADNPNPVSDKCGWFADATKSLSLLFLHPALTEIVGIGGVDAAATAVGVVATATAIHAGVCGGRVLAAGVLVVATIEGGVPAPRLIFVAT